MSPGVFDTRRLHRKRRSIIAQAEKARAKAGESNDQALANQIDADCYSACKHIDDRLDWVLDQAIRQEAQELDIAMPLVTEREMWQRDEDQSLYLTSQGRFYLRRLIDQEKARRFEVKTLWVTKIILPLAGVLVGIIGALTGLVAVFQHWK
jgi:hypothetical protein